MVIPRDSALYSYLAGYQSVETTKRDISNALNEYQALTVSKESYTFNDGTIMELANLKGTIPVKYKGSTYNIPICIWLMDTHPKNAPICYVRPTSDMYIKPSIFVDQNGKIYLPYLHDWSPGSSDLLGLIEVMIVTFGEKPPVFSMPSTTTPYPLPINPMSPYPSANPMYPPPVPQPPGGISSMPYPPYFYKPETPGLPPSSGTITDEHIRASLLSAVDDKLKRRLREQYMQAQAELETLKRTEVELTQGRSRLDGILMTIEKEQVELDKSIKILQEKEQELEKEVSKLQNQESIDVDEAVITTAPLYKQLVNTYAEEAATEDAIYHMGEALRKGVIDLDVFLKQVRILSHRQFMLRATMQKCRQKAGLAG